MNVGKCWLERAAAGAWVLSAGVTPCPTSTHCSPWAVDTFICGRRGDRGASEEMWGHQASWDGSLCHGSEV